MSQPVGITVNIKMSPDAFKKYMKAEASVIARLLWDLRKTEAGDDFFFIKYIKRTESFYWFIFFNHGDSDYMVKSPFYRILKGLQDYLEPCSEGYLLGTLDASRPWLKEASAFNYRIQNGAFVEGGMTDEQFKAIKKDSGSFFRQAEKGYFFDQLDSGEPVVDKAIHTQYEKIKEDERRRNVIENLHTATAENPLRLFCKWYYDGKYVISPYKRKYTGLNVRELRETPYGVCDSSYIVATIYNEWCKSRELMLEMDPARFKQMSKGYATLYFKSDIMVYNGDLDPMPEADPDTFRVLEEYIAVDKNFIYLTDRQKKIPMEELGEPYRYDTHFTCLMKYCSWVLKEFGLVGTRWRGWMPQLSNFCPAPSCRSILPRLCRLANYLCIIVKSDTGGGGIRTENFSFFHIRTTWINIRNMSVTYPAFR